METINFTQKPEGYVAEIVAEDAISISLNFADIAYLSFFQKSVSDNDFAYSQIGDGFRVIKSFDADYTAEKYPKYLKIVSSKLPNKAYVTE